jgi:4'-phosphopantetheinyl transferase EntD
MNDVAKGLIAAIVPAGVCYSEQVGELGGSLLPGEDDLLGPRTAIKRRREFTAGRTCAREALALLGIQPRPLLQGKGHEPLWPEGIAGSITHCKNYCAAAVVRKESCRSIGIDAEPNEPLPSAVLALIACEREQEWTLRAAKQDICRDRLLFSIKESVYKAWYPLERCWLDFHEAEIEVDAETQTFQATLLRTASACPRVLQGAFIATRSHLFTCAFVSAPVCNMSANLRGLVPSAGVFFSPGHQGTHR